MADEAVNTKVISKTNAGFPEWLDFEKLRREGMDYLGELSGKIWTDHNTHDPGITILETLCYALLDLGYRTSLPDKDLFARDPNDTGAEDNFFTPAQILGCNPLTVLDFRKLLVDTEGVKNAWLVPAEDISVNSICGVQEPVNPSFKREALRVQRNDCKSFLNGLYHVYLDLDFDPVQDKTRKTEVIKAVKETLMSHRNLCEDFYDITILCKQPVGVCADIELRPDADIDKVFLEILEKLRDFISPAPKFYRLQQLLDKGKSMEEIFEGRPVNLSSTHGFLDTGEFESIVMHKELHLSDIYNVLFTIPGVAAVRNLGLQNCSGKTCDDPGLLPWIFKMFKNHVPDFSVDCSGFHFTKNGQEIPLNRKKYSEFIKLNFSNNGKTIIANTDTYLDLPVPSGNYRPDLAAYFPLENEFPKVFGLPEGSLPENVSPARMAQSLQMRGYLLFFDHLLAGYLNQLKNIRQLFSWQPEERMRYQGNTLSSFTSPGQEWPGLEKLLRFSINENDIRPADNAKAYPVYRKELEKLITAGKISDCDGEKKLNPYLFCSAAARDTAVEQLVQDALSGNLAAGFIETGNDCRIIYLTGSSGDYALAGMDRYKSANTADAALDTLRFLVSEKNNYHLFPADTGNNFSFDIRNNMQGYWNYLQQLTGAEDAYIEKRELFLNHLLARFAETFTDYALLSYSFLPEKERLKNDIRNKENFLSNYPQLSSNRGKGYDYKLNGWNTTNVSGFESRIEAYAGTGMGKQENLCHFEVLEYDEQSLIQIGWKNHQLFTSEYNYASREEATDALNELFILLQQKENYAAVYIPHEDKYEVQVKTMDTVFTYPARFDTGAEAGEAIDSLCRLFSPSPLAADIIPVQFQYELVLSKKTGTGKWNYASPVVGNNEKLVVDAALLKDFVKKDAWVKKEDGATGKAVTEATPAADFKWIVNAGNEKEFINKNSFETSVIKVDVKEKKDIYRFTAGDKGKNFFFTSASEFDNKEVAVKSLDQFLFLLSRGSAFSRYRNERNEYIISVEDKGSQVAVNTIEYNTPEEAKSAVEFITSFAMDQLYSLDVSSIATKWRFQLPLAVPGTPAFLFESSKEYTSSKAAEEAAAGLVSSNKNYTVVPGSKNGGLEITETGNSNKTAAAFLKSATTEKPGKAAETANQLLALKKEMGKAVSRPAGAERMAMIIPGMNSKDGNWGYRLVKKDGYHAWYDMGKADCKDKSVTAKKVAEIYKKFRKETGCLEICYGGKNILEQENSKTRQKEYHYQVRTFTQNGPVKGEWVLFVGRTGYNSPEEAQQAFDKEFVSLLSVASDTGNYGTKIRFGGKDGMSASSASEPEILAYIPDATMKLFGENRQFAAAQLAALSASFPIKNVQLNSKEFFELFLCPDDYKDNPVKDCPKAAEPDVYYFKYGDNSGGGNAWTSSHWFDTVESALKGFYFFQILLKYKGNYFTGFDDCTCTCRLYLREILAVGRRRFPNEHDAWGKEGVQKFISASQSEGAFQLFRRKNECYYGFNVSCGNLGLIHPCTYDTEEKRDQAMEKLFIASKKILAGYQEYGFLKNSEKIIEESGIALTKAGIQFNPDDLVGMVKQRIALYLKQASSSLPAPQPISPDPVLELKDQAVLSELKQFAGYFPVVRKKLDIPGREDYKYFLEIRLPDFCKDAEAKAQPCGCGKTTEKDDCACCCTAWVSDCCFDSYREALAYLRNITKCLSEYANYYPVFNKCCGPYGIRFYCNCNEPIKPAERMETSANARIYVPDRGNTTCCNEIIAFNPQYYTTPQMVCDAADRARGLINAEGLHLIEHILLRPHCTDGDCKCVIQPCGYQADCEFEWDMPQDDPCTRDEKICFIPGADPYSFTATVILPVWPERFRNKGNRQIMENMLYREAPAHVMLRVLWLTPEDLCRFEYLYRNWRKWLANKMVCNEPDPACRLIEFLFERRSRENREPRKFYCFEGEDCIPCADQTTADDICAGTKETEKDPNEYVNTINALYCWPYICPPGRLGQQMETLTKEHVPADAESPVMVDPAEKEREIIKRFNQYENKIRAIVKKTGNLHAEQAASFLSKYTTDFAPYHDVVYSILVNKKTEGAKRILTASEKHILIENITWHYLDMLLLKNAFDKHSTELKNLMKMLGEKGLKPDFENWDGRGLQQYEQQINSGQIKKIFK